MNAGKWLSILFLLLLAFALRVWQLAEIPPGLTHDEANHGREALEVLQGVWRIYYPVSYGREPLYNYVLAGAIGLWGSSLFSLRLVSAYFGLAAAAGAFAWGRRVFGYPTAYLAAGLLAVSFWPLATSRQILRSSILPFFTILAVFSFWLLLQRRRQSQAVHWLLLGFVLGTAATLYIYMAARVLWLIFPLLLIYLALLPDQRDKFRRVWRPALAGLAGVALLFLPLLVYLRHNPDAEARVGMLSRPLEALLAGDAGPLWRNIWGALMAFGRPGYGDHFLAYNLPGRPLLEIPTAFFLLVGLAVCLWRWRRPAYALLLLWFGLGVVPSLVTGPEAGVTRNLAALIPAFLLPAVGFMALVGRLPERRRLSRRVPLFLAVGWLLWAGLSANYDYFFHWSQSPDVRAAYQQTLVQSLHYAAEMADVGQPVVVSSLHPGPAHDRAVAQVVMGGDEPALRGVDARTAMIFPRQQEAYLLLPASTPLHPAFAHLVEPLRRVELRADDLDPYFTVMRLRPYAPPAQQPSLNFGDALYLVEARWLASPVAPGSVAELFTLWQVIEPERAGALDPFLLARDAALFTHLLDENGDIVAQRDGLDAPAWSWRAGDWVAQVQQIWLPPDMAAGRYDTAIGVYERASGARLPVWEAAGPLADDRAFVIPLWVE